MNWCGWFLWPIALLRGSTACLLGTEIPKYDKHLMGLGPELGKKVARFRATG